MFLVTFENADAGCCSVAIIQNDIHKPNYWEVLAMHDDPEWLKAYGDAWLRTSRNRIGECGQLFEPVEYTPFTFHVTWAAHV